MPNVNPYLRQNEETVVLRDFRHASRLYVDGAYKLMPKASWLYYVVFDVGSNVVKDLIFGGRKKHTEIGMLVKNVELPKFQINTETLNQYNRKTIIQKNITYQPVAFTFHDDTSNYVNDMWINYYRYYYNDDPKKSPNLDDTLKGLANNALNGLVGSSIGGLLSDVLGIKKDSEVSRYGNTKYKNIDSSFDPTNYGLNVYSTKDTKKPFFRSITIYQLNRQQFTSYQLVNPMIRSWEHDRLDQTQGSKLSENKMSLEYEAVLYGKGSVSKDNPAGFAVFHYDNTPSPLGVGNRGLKSVFRDALKGVTDVFGDVLGSANLPGNSLFFDALGAVGSTALYGGFGGALENRPNPSPSYSTLSSIRYPTQNSVNGLGVDLRLNLGNTPATSGQTAATPIALSPAPFIAPEATSNVFFGDGVITRPIITGGVSPVSAEPTQTSESMIESLDRLNNKVMSAQMYRTTEDTTPAGSTSAPGRYFPMPAPLDDTRIYTNDAITDNSNIRQIKKAISDLNAAWSSDNDFVASQTIGQETIDAKLQSASSSAEFNSIKNEASSVILAVKSLQSSVDAKYQTEYNRLTALLDAKQTKISGNANVV